MSGEQQKSSKLVETMIGDIEDVANVPIFTRRSTTQNETTPGSANEGVSSIRDTTPDPLNTAFINTDESTNVSAQGSQISLSQPQQQSQTTKETASTIEDLVIQTVRQEEYYPPLDLYSPLIQITPTISTVPTKTMVSTGTMTRTPIMKSVGTMPKTPTMTSIGTMPITPTIAPIETMSSTPTMPSNNDTIDLCSESTPSTIDCQSPIVEIIDISSSPETTTTTDNTSFPLLRPASQ